MQASISLNTALLIGVVGAILAVLTIANSLVLVEAIRQIAQIRYRVEMDDRAVVTSLGASAGKHIGQLLDAATLDRLRSAQDRIEESDSLLVFLSTDCKTCRLVAEGVGHVRAQHAGTMSVFAVVDGRDEDAVGGFYDATRLAAESSLGDDGNIAAALGVSVRPTLVFLRGGRVAEGATLNSAKQLAVAAAAYADNVRREAVVAI